MRILKSFAAPVVAASILASIAPASAQTIFQGIGGPAVADPTTPAGSAKEAFNNFNTAAGANARRITWDGVPVPKTGTNPTEVAISNNITGLNTTRFANVGAFYPETYAVANDGFAAANPTVAGQFPAFSGDKTFAAFGTNGSNEFTIEQSFVVPGAGSTAPAFTRGFGVIFQDVEIANLTSIEYFNNSISLGKFFVPVAGNGQFSFLGVLYDNPIVSNVVISVGNKPIFSVNGGVVTSTGAEDLANGIDLVATDDFVFANPTAAAPEPGAGIFALLGLVSIPVAKRLRKG